MEGRPAKASLSSSSDSSVASVEGFDVSSASSEASVVVAGRASCSASLLVAFPLVPFFFFFLLVLVSVSR